MQSFLVKTEFTRTLTCAERFLLGKGIGSFRWQIVFSILGRVGGWEGIENFSVGEHAWGGEGRGREGE